MSFSVRTPEGCICKMPDALEDLAELKLPETQENLEASTALLEVGKEAAKLVLEAGKVGDAESGIVVSISGHANEPPAIGDALSISISAQTATDPPQRS